MHKTVRETRALARELLEHTQGGGVDVIVAPPFTALFAAQEEFAGTHIALAAQTMHENDGGPHTGEISPAMLVELGVRYVILGHSERRQQCNETDRGVNRKVHAALRHGLTPIVAVGETAQEHAAGQSAARVCDQTRLAFADVSDDDIARCVVAYEPIWAIGTGLSDTPDSANAVIGNIRESLPGLANARLLYGGSMKPENAAALLAEPNIDGGLIGGASLVATMFGAIVEAAAARVPA
jgi:triosephosphate isomerase